MASNTPKLGLLKKDPAMDGNETFNIQTMLNDNWDKIDEAVGNIEVPEASTTQKGIVQLSNATDGAREDVAATERAVKAAYERGSEGVDAAATAQTSLVAHLADNTSHVHYGPDTGTANAKAVSISPAPTAYVEGMAVSFRNAVQNTGAVTIDVNGLGAKSILKSNGNALVSGNLKANSIYTLRYNGTAFILQGEGGEYGTATAADVRSTKTIGTENGLVNGALVTRDSVGALTVTPTTMDQTFQAGIYDKNITVKAMVTSPKYYEFSGSVTLPANSTLNLNKGAVTNPHALMFSEGTYGTRSVAMRVNGTILSNATGTYGLSLNPGLSDTTASITNSASFAMYLIYYAVNGM